MSDHPDSAALAAALDTVADPVREAGILASGRAASPRIADGVASTVIDVADLGASTRTDLERAAKAALAAVPGVAQVRVLLTADRRERRLIAVASGKGGVGKSTLAANLAIALLREGVATGLVDADIYGPSQPRLLDAPERPFAEAQTLIPVATKWGVPMLSMGQLLPAGKALAWRGPMAASALGQLVGGRWEADTIIVDLPPGTGDVQLSMIQKHRPAGAVIVSTPQDLALIDATRAIDLFETANVPILGIVENMAGYACPHCGEISDPFGRGGAEQEAARLAVPFLGRIPLDIAIRRASDAGVPPAAGEGPAADAFRAIARALIARMEPEPR